MSNWAVAKFGGSSVKDAQSMMRVVGIVDENPNIKIVVISATQNTTNQLEFIAQSALRSDHAKREELVLELKKRHLEIAESLYASQETRDEVIKLVDEADVLSKSITEQQIIRPMIMDRLYSIGERMSSAIIADLCKLRIPERHVRFLDAREIIKTDSNFKKAEPQIELIAKLTKEVLGSDLTNNTLIITQGFIGEDLEGSTTTLGREGSDYSAALFGEAIDASIVQIWTDVPGIASTDPRITDEARFIERISYEEATALASLGAKVLFPTTLTPTKRKNIPVLVASSLNSDLGGTIVTGVMDEDFKLKAVSHLSRPEESILSFIGSHLNKNPNLAKELITELKELNLVLDAQDNVSISFKLPLETNPKDALLIAHKVLINLH